MKIKKSKGVPDFCALIGRVFSGALRGFLPALGAAENNKIQTFFCLNFIGWSEGDLFPP